MLTIKRTNSNLFQHSLCQLDGQPLSGVVAAYDRRQLSRSKMCQTSRSCGQLGFFLNQFILFLLQASAKKISVCLGRVSLPQSPTFILFYVPIDRGEVRPLAPTSHLRCLTVAQIGRAVLYDRQSRIKRGGCRNRIWVFWGMKIGEGKNVEKGGEKENPRRCAEAGLWLPKQRRLFLQLSNCQLSRRWTKLHIPPRLWGETVIAADV